MPTIDQLKRSIRASTPDPVAYGDKLELLCTILDKAPSFLITQSDYVLSDDEYQVWLGSVERLEQGEPLAYVLGRQGFWGREFVVNRHTLIPRPDSERLIETVLDFVKVKGLTAPRILDLGTGSGCLAITLAKELPGSQVMAVDFCADALQVATQNGKHLQANNCQFIQSDWFDKVAGVFDVIISNPPYIAPDDEHLPSLRAEPVTALVADELGLADIRHIVAGAGRFLVSGGLLAVEHGYDQGQAVAKIFTQCGFSDVQTVKDYGNNDRLTLGVYHAN